jgi:cellulose synthase/poly-beta-1,6-N-acetylglucosamine synthase-like glycosyltransferase
MSVAATLLTLLALALLVPASVLLIQVASALPARHARNMPGGRRPALAIVVPAHNEALLIAGTLRPIVQRLAAGERVLVVADNCTDDTAAIARAAGAEVLERTDATRRGKGYALDFGVRHLAGNPPEVVLVIDGDCKVEGDAIERLARTCLQADRPVQALYLMHAPLDAALRIRIAEFAWLVKNKVRPLGMLRLGLPCQLMGTGMAFSWADISTAALASGHIVEDMKLGIELAGAGRPPLFCPDALVTSQFPSTAEGIADQRTRWEHGHLGMLAGTAPRMIAQGLAQANLPALALLADLCVPPLALLLLLVCAAGAGSAALSALGGTTLPLWLSAVALALSGASVLLAWARYGRGVISFADMACAPLYAAWKIPLYLMFLAKRQGKWVRTRRDAE